MDSADGRLLMRLSALRDKNVRCLNGRKFGRVHEVHCEHGQVTFLVCGPGGFIERWTGRSKGRRVPWDSICRIDVDAVVVASDSENKPSKPKRYERK